MPEKSSSKMGLLEKFVPILLVITVILAGVVGALWQKVSTLEKGGTSLVTDTAAQPDASGKLAEADAKKVEKPGDKDHIRGSLDAQIFLIEYSDLECPFCKQFHLTAQQAIDEYQ